MVLTGQVIETEWLWDCEKESVDLVDDKQMLEK